MSIDLTLQTTLQLVKVAASDGKRYRNRVTLVILDAKGDVLTYKENGRLNLPGGGTENGNVNASAKREALEEVGYAVKDIASVGVKPVLFPFPADFAKKQADKGRTHDGWRNYVRVANVDKKDKKLFNSEGDGKKNIKFVPIDELIKAFSGKRSKAWKVMDQQTLAALKAVKARSTMSDKEAAVRLNVVKLLRDSDVARNTRWRLERDIADRSAAIARNHELINAHRHSMTTPGGRALNYAGQNDLGRGHPIRRTRNTNATLQANNARGHVALAELPDQIKQLDRDLAHTALAYGGALSLGAGITYRHVGQFDDVEGVEGVEGAEDAEDAFPTPPGTALPIAGGILGAAGGFGTSIALDGIFDNIAEDHGRRRGPGRGLSSLTGVVADVLKKTSAVRNPFALSTHARRNLNERGWYDFVADSSRSTVGEATENLRAIDNVILPGRVRNEVYGEEVTRLRRQRSDANYRGGQAHAQLESRDRQLKQVLRDSAHTTLALGGLGAAGVGANYALPDAPKGSSGSAADDPLGNLSRTVGLVGALGALSAGSTGGAVLMSNVLRKRNRSGISSLTDVVADVLKNKTPRRAPTPTRTTPRERAALSEYFDSFTELRPTPGRFNDILADTQPTPGRTHELLPEVRPTSGRINNIEELDDYMTS